MVNSSDFKEFCPSRADQETVQNYLNENKKVTETGGKDWTYWESVKHAFNQGDLDKSKEKAVSVLKNCVIKQVKAQLDPEVAKSENDAITKLAQGEAENILGDLKRDNFFSIIEEERIHSIANNILFHPTKENFLP